MGDRPPIYKALEELQRVTGYVWTRSELADEQDRITVAYTEFFVQTALFEGRQVSEGRVVAGKQAERAQKVRRYEEGKKSAIEDARKDVRKSFKDYRKKYEREEEEEMKQAKLDAEIEQIARVTKGGAYRPSDPASRNMRSRLMSKLRTQSSSDSSSSSSSDSSSDSSCGLGYGYDQENSETDSDPSPCGENEECGDESNMVCSEVIQKRGISQKSGQGAGDVDDSAAVSSRVSDATCDLTDADNWEDIFASEDIKVEHEVVEEDKNGEKRTDIVHEREASENNAIIAAVQGNGEKTDDIVQENTTKRQTRAKRERKSQKEVVLEDEEEVKKIRRSKRKRVEEDVSESEKVQKKKEKKARGDRSARKERRSTRKNRD